ncbi:MAG: energy-coupling factor transporter ATPase [Clostridia bacterium]|nr:energy-coupling factor transporter ATPase [Clostridia bacterium]
MSFIEAEHVSFTYDDGTPESVPALRDMTLTIEEREYVAVLGHNGSGKSTFAKLLNLILLPTEGKLSVAGHTVSEEMSEDDVFAVRRQVGMVFQNPDNQMVATTVEEDVAFGPENLGIPHPELAERVSGALECVGMSAFARHAPHQLSGGQKQRVAIAGIIAMMPRCIVFDESTAMLDPVGRSEVMATMEKLNREQGITIIHITHYMEEAARANRIIVINDGELFMDGTPREVFSRAEELRSVGLELTQSGELIHELRLAGMADLPNDCLTEDECVEAILRAYRARNGGAS